MANQVLLAPGKSITFTDTANPRINVVVTAPGDTYLNLGRLVADIEKGGNIYSTVSAVQIKAADTIVSNADGSWSLRPSSGQSYFVPKDAAPGPGRITLEGGAALLDSGRVVIHSASILRSEVAVAAPGTPALNAYSAIPTVPLAAAGQSAAPVIPSQVQAVVPSQVQTGGGLPTGNIVVPGSASVTQASGTGLSINQTTSRSIGGFSTFNVGSSAGVTITQPSGGISLNNVSSGNTQVFGTLTPNGGTLNVGQSSGVTVTQSSGIVTLGGVPGSNMIISGNLSAAGNIVINNPGGTITVGPGAVMPSGSITFNTAPVMRSGNISINNASVPSQGSVVGVITTAGSAKPPAAPVIVTPR